MYLRYRAQYHHALEDRIKFGFFWAGDYLTKNGHLEKEDFEELEKLIHFFDHELPIPDYYQSEKNRQEAKSATSWFKDTAEQFISSMNRMGHILEKNGVEVERIHARKVPGKIIYEDEYQITVISYKDVKHRVI